jgi:TPR repeat protein
LCLFEGRGVPIDYVLAAKYFKLSADQNDADGQFYYGLSLFEGRGVPIDYVLAAKYFKFSADQNDAAGQFHYGLCLFKGRGVPIDYVLAAKYFKLSADQNRRDGQVYYGLCLFEGLGVPVDYVESAKYLKTGSSQDSPFFADRTHQFIAFMYKGTVHFSRAVQGYTLAAHVGITFGMTTLGISYKSDRGRLENHTRALKWYSANTQSDGSQAQRQFHCYLQSGLGCPAALLQSVEWYEQTLDQEDIEGGLGLASSLQFGVGCEVDLDDAARQYEASLPRLRAPVSGRPFGRLPGPGKAAFPLANLPAPSDSHVTPDGGSAQPHPHGASSLISDYIQPSRTTGSGNFIGVGGFSRVSVERNPETGENVAVKRFSTDAFDQSSFLCEVGALANLNHPCILRIRGWKLPTGREPAEIWTVIAESGSLRDCMEKVGSETQFPFWNPTGKGILILGIVFGMRFIHSKGIIHGDLKPSNILLSSRGEAIISDFGLSRFEAADYTLTADSGTVNYAAPELFRDGMPHTRQADVFAFGLVLYEILTGIAVFPSSESPFTTLRRIRDGDMPVITEQCGRLMQHLIPRCWSMEPTKRPTFDEILGEFKAADFRIVSTADAGKLGAYVGDIERWEAEEMAPTQSRS